MATNANTISSTLKEWLNNNCRISYTEDNGDVKYYYTYQSDYLVKRLAEDRYIILEAVSGSENSTRLNMILPDRVFTKDEMTDIIGEFHCDQKNIAILGSE